jgi:NDP-sugar pyrophosphorylase family protein
MIPEGYYTLGRLFPRLIRMGELTAYEVRERFYEVGSIRLLREFEEFAKKVLSPYRLTGADRS